MTCRSGTAGTGCTASFVAHGEAVVHGGDSDPNPRAPTTKSVQAWVHLCTVCGSRPEPPCVGPATDALELRRKGTRRSCPAFKGYCARDGSASATAVLMHRTRSRRDSGSNSEQGGAPEVCRFRAETERNWARQCILRRPPHSWTRTRFSSPTLPAVYDRLSETTWNKEKGTETIPIQNTGVRTNQWFTEKVTSAHDKYCSGGVRMKRSRRNRGVWAHADCHRQQLRPEQYL